MINRKQTECKAFRTTFEAWADHEKATKKTACMFWMGYTIVTSAAVHEEVTGRMSWEVFVDVTM